MSKQAGNLHWRRMRLVLQAGITEVDTGLTTGNRGYNDGPGSPVTPIEPPLGVFAGVLPPAGALPASRIQVIVLPPTSGWTDIEVFGEPYFNTTTETIHVAFNNNGQPSVLNVLFWNPHTLNSPGLADTYNEPIED